MKSLEDIYSIDEVKKEWGAQNGLASTLFGITKNINNTERTILGYLEELSLKASPKQEPIVKQLVSLNKKYHHTVLLLESLQALTGLEETASKSFYFQQLVDEIGENFDDLKFSLSSVNDKILIYTQPGALAKTIGAVLASFSSTKKLSLGFRKSGRYGVITIKAQINRWLDNDIFYALSNPPKYLRPSKNMNLNILVCNYSLSVLKSINVVITTKVVKNRQILYVHVPLTRQLNVFDESPLKE